MTAEQVLEAARARRSGDERAIVSLIHHLLEQEADIFAIAVGDHLVRVEVERATGECTWEDDVRIEKGVLCDASLGKLFRRALETHLVKLKDQRDETALKK